MSSELETGGLASLGGLGNKQRADLSGQPCRNCGNDVVGRYCDICGQLAASFHRPIWSLIGETIGDSLALDGRLARTMPLLMFRPGRLTRNYTKGQRARYVPPFRLFLLASLLFYFTLFAIIGNASWIDDLNFQSQVETQDEAAAQDQPVPGIVRFMDDEGKIDREAAKTAVEDETGHTPTGFEAAAIEGLATAVENPRLLLLGIERWAPRLSLLLVPGTMLALILLHVWRRRLYVYDHAIHALHLHSWIYLTGALAMGLGILIPGSAGWIAPLYAVWFVFYLWRSLKVAGNSGVFVSILRAVSVLIAWFFAVIFFMIAALLLGAVSI